jgi:SAM-dependent methyltransferase
MESEAWVPPDEWVPAGIDTERPSAARIYDYFLGGAHNFEVDRQVAEQLLAVHPEIAAMAQANRAFLRRAVEFLVDAGIRQFLDIGSGVPTVGHVHEIAQGAAPESRVAFVDIDPVAVAHSQLILEGNDRTAVIQEDIRKPEQILNHAEVQGLLDFDRPVAVLLVSLLHFVPDSDDLSSILSHLTRPLTSGSYLVISHGTEDERDDEAEGKEIYRRGGIEVTTRSREQVEALFDGWDLVEPGVVWVPQWRPDSPEDVGDHPASSGVYAGVGRKR